MTSTMRPTREKREQQKKLGWLREAQAVLGWAVILILVALLGAIYLNQASRIASVGRRVQVLQNDLEQLKRENADLARQIAETQSLDRLEQEAIRLGFVPARPEDIEYIVVPDQPAAESEAAEVETVPEVEPEPPATMSGAIWSAIKSGIGNFVYGEASEQ